jgi:hypothetical protein
MSNRPPFFLSLGGYSFCISINYIHFIAPDTPPPPSPSSRQHTSIVGHREVISYHRVLLGWTWVGVSISFFCFGQTNILHVTWSVYSNDNNDGIFALVHNWRVFTRWARVIISSRNGSNIERGKNKRKKKKKEKGPNANTFVCLFVLNGRSRLALPHTHTRARIAPPPRPSSSSSSSSFRIRYRSRADTS